MKTTPTPLSNSVNISGPILIVGATGMLGSDLASYFKTQLGPEAILTPSSNTLDITDERQIQDFIDLERPTIVINAAAYTDVDGAEKHREQAEALNITATRFLTTACQDARIPLVHYSTDQVFDGTKREAWKETDSPNPLNWYARTKLEGEQAALEWSQSLVLRVQWLYGKKKNRFTSLKNKTVFSPFSDQLGAPTWTQHIAQTTWELLNKKQYGLFHFAYDDHASWEDVFCFVKDNLSLNIRLQPRATAELALPAQRPLNVVLSNEKLRGALGQDTMGSWKTALNDFLSECHGEN